MTFMEFIRQKKEIDIEGKNPFDFMDEYYEEYMEFMKGIKDGCGPKE